MENETISLKDKLSKIPVINIFVRLLSGIKLPGLEGLSLYDLLELYVIGIAKGALGTRASAIAYSFFMALFPFLLFLIIVIPHVPIDGFQHDFLAFLESFLPPTTSDFFNDNIFVNLESNNQNGSLISSVFLVSIFLMANGVNAVFSGFENSYHEQLTRNGIRQYIYALGIALILAFLLIVTVAGLGLFEIYIISPLYEKLIDEGFAKKGSNVLWVTLAKYVFYILMMYLATATMYYFGTREGKNSRFFSVGALFTTLLIILTSYLFGIYIENFANYNKLYGSIGALLILLFYLWLNANVILLGFELNTALNQLRKRF